MSSIFLYVHRPSRLRERTEHDANKNRYSEIPEAKDGNREATDQIRRRHQSFFPTKSLRQSKRVKKAVFLFKKNVAKICCILRVEMSRALSIKSFTTRLRKSDFVFRPPVSRILSALTGCIVNNYMSSLLTYKHRYKV